MSHMWACCWRRSRLLVRDMCQTANPTWGDIFECCFIAQSSKLERLFPLKCGTRDVRALSFELSKMSPQVGSAVHIDAFVVHVVNHVLHVYSRISHVCTLLEKVVSAFVTRVWNVWMSLLMSRVCKWVVWHEYMSPPPYTHANKYRAYVHIKYQLFLLP